MSLFIPLKFSSLRWSATHRARIGAQVFGCSFVRLLDKLIKIQLCTRARGDERMAHLKTTQLKSITAAASSTLLCCCVALSMVVSNLFAVAFFAWFVSYFEEKKTPTDCSFVIMFKYSNNYITIKRSKLNDDSHDGSSALEQQSYRLPKSKISEMTHACV